MTKLMRREQTLPAMPGEAIAKVRQLEGKLLEMPQAEITTTHSLHAGLYARTAHLPAGVCGVGTLIKIPTLVIVSGHATAYVGDGSIELVGYHVLQAQAGRKQVFVAHADTVITMCFATKAKSVEEAEAEFTDETDLLMSRRSTGETI